MAVTATGTYVTAAGYRLLTKLLAAQGELNFTRAAVGTGKIPEGYSAEALTGLTQYKMDAEIASYGVESEKAYVTCQISSEKVSEGFLVTEVGVFATDPDEGEILYGYMDISGDPTYIYSNGSGSMAKFAEFQMYFLIGALQKVTAIITPGSYVSREALKAGLDTKVTADGGEAGLTVVDFDDSGTVSGITDFQSFLSKLKRGGKLGELIRNFRAGMKYVIHLGLLVNNCLSDRTDMALTAAQGKALQEQITQLNGKIEKILKISKAIEALPSEAYSYTFNTTAQIPFGNRTMYKSTKGIFVTTGVDGILLAVGTDGTFYTSYRDGDKWQGFKAF